MCKQRKITFISPSLLNWIWTMNKLSKWHACEFFGQQGGKLTQLLPKSFLRNMLKYAYCVYTYLQIWRLVTLWGQSANFKCTKPMLLGHLFAVVLASLWQLLQLLTFALHLASFTNIQFIKYNSQICTNPIKRLLYVGHYQDNHDEWMPL